MDARLETAVFGTHGDLGIGRSRRNQPPGTVRVGPNRFIPAHFRVDPGSLGYGGGNPIDAFLHSSSTRIIDAFTLSRSNRKQAIIDIDTMMPDIINEAIKLGDHRLTRQVLKRAFDSFSKKPEEQREFSGLLGMVVIQGVPKYKNALEDDAQIIIQATEKSKPQAKRPKKIISITTSPTIDMNLEKTLESAKAWKNRTGLGIDAGGGGLNIAKALRYRGVYESEVQTIFFQAGHVGNFLHTLLEEKRVSTADSINIGQDETRVCIAVSSGDKRDNMTPKGTPVTATAKNELENKLFNEETGVKPGDMVVISGSLAPGLSDSYYAELGAKLREKGIIVIVDTKGKPLQAIFDQAAATVVSMNKNEFGELYGIDPENEEALCKKAREIIESQPPDKAIEEIIITLDKKGAISIRRERVWKCPAPNIDQETVQSEIGAGDTRLAEDIYQRWLGAKPEEAFAYGIAAATESVRHVGTGEGAEGRHDARVNQLFNEIELEERVLVENPGVNGVQPTADIVRQDRISVQIVTSIAAGMSVLGLIGNRYAEYVGKGVPEDLALKFASRDLDVTSQNIFMEMLRSAQLNARLLGYEGRKKIDDIGALFAGQILAVDAPTGTMYVFADVLEATKYIVRGESPDGAGGSSFFFFGPLAKAFGAVPDESGAGLVFHPGLIKVDPDAPLVNILKGAAQANNVTLNELDVYIMNRKRLTREYLEPLNSFQRTFPGMKINMVQHGSHDQALRAILGQKDGRIPVFLGTAGATEAATVYLTALLFDNVSAGLRIYGDYSKSIGDAVGSLSKTLAELDEVEMRAVKKVIPDFTLDKLPKDIQIRYLFSRGVQEDLLNLRPYDGQSILNGARLFTRDSLVFPKQDGDTPNIWLKDNLGNPISLVENVPWDSNIFSGATAYLVPSNILGIPGIERPYKAPNDKYSKIHTLVIERVGGETYVWLKPYFVGDHELSSLLPKMFVHY